MSFDIIFEILNITPEQQNLFMFLQGAPTAISMKYYVSTVL